MRKILCKSTLKLDESDSQYLNPLYTTKQEAKHFLPKLFPLRHQNLINSLTVFSATLIVLPTLVLLVYFTGLPSHRSLYANALLSTTIVSVVFLSFITTGLYNGWKLKENIGSFRDHFRRLERPPIASFNSGAFADDSYFDNPETGLAGCLPSIFWWLVVGVFGAFFIWFFGAIVWGSLLALAAILYWLIFRAYRLIFKNSAACKGRFFKSLGVAIVFTFLYNCFIYAIILGAHFLGK